MGRLKYYNKTTNQWEYADAALSGGGASSEELNKLKYKSLNINKLTDYLYSATFNTYDYNTGKEYYSKYEPALGACSVIRKGNYIGRNFDWKYDENVDIYVKTNSTMGRHASHSVIHASNIITEALMNSGVWNDIFEVIPFMTSDGQNDAGVFCEINVVPAGDKGRTTGTNPGKEDMCILMLVRFILDYADSATHAIDLLDEFNLWAPNNELMSLECHFMIADKNFTYIVEFVNNEVVIFSDNDSRYPKIPNYKNILTNFYLDGWDGRIITGFDAEEEIDHTTTTLTAHAMGLERYKIAYDLYDTIEDADDMRYLMNKLRYTNMYKRDKYPFWYSEYTDGDYTIYKPKAAFEDIVDELIEEYENRTRNGVTWFTNHSSIYDIKSRILTVVPQEFDQEFIFGLETKGENIGMIDTPKTFTDDLIDKEGLDSRETVYLRASLMGESLIIPVRKGSTGKETMAIANNMISPMLETNLFEILENYPLPYLEDETGNVICANLGKLFGSPDAQGPYYPIRFKMISNSVESKEDYALEDTIFDKDLNGYLFESKETDFYVLDENEEFVKFTAYNEANPMSGEPMNCMWMSFVNNEKYNKDNLFSIKYIKEGSSGDFIVFYKNKYMVTYDGDPCYADEDIYSTTADDPFTIEYYGGDVITVSLILLDLKAMSPYAPTLPSGLEAIVIPMGGTNDLTTKDFLDEFGLVEGSQYIIENGVTIPGSDIKLNNFVIVNLLPGASFIFCTKKNVSDASPSDYILATDVIQDSIGVYADPIFKGNVTVDFTDVEIPDIHDDTITTNIELKCSYDSINKAIVSKNVSWNEILEKVANILMVGSIDIEIDEKEYEDVICTGYYDSEESKIITYPIIDENDNLCFASSTIKSGETYYAVNSDHEFDYVTVGLYIDNNSQTKVQSTFIKGISLTNVSSDSGYPLNGQIIKVPVVYILDYEEEIYESFYSYVYLDSYNRPILLTNKEFTEMISEEDLSNDVIKSFDGSDIILSNNDVYYTGGIISKFNIVIDDETTKEYSFKVNLTVGEESTTAIFNFDTLSGEYWGEFVDDNRFNIDKMFDIFSYPIIIEDEEYENAISYNDWYIVKDPDGNICTAYDPIIRYATYTVEELPK